MVERLSHRLPMGGCQEVLATKPPVCTQQSIGSAGSHTLRSGEQNLLEHVGKYGLLWLWGDRCQLHPIPDLTIEHESLRLRLASRQ